MTTVDRHTHPADPPTPPAMDTARITAAATAILQAAGAGTAVTVQVHPDTPSGPRLMLRVREDAGHEGARRVLVRRLAFAAAHGEAPRADDDRPAPHVGVCDMPFHPPLLEAHVTAADGLVVEVTTDLDEPEEVAR